MLRDSLPEALRPEEGNLGRVVREGLALFLARFGDRRAGMSKRSERSNIHDCIVEVAKRTYPGRYSDGDNPFLLRLGSYRIKPKKLGRRLETSNNTTQRVLDFLGQTWTEVFDLFGNTELVNLHLGYVPNELNLLESTVWITRPSGLGRNEWVYEIQAVPLAEVVQPVLPVTSPEGPTPSRVKPKPSELPSAKEDKK